jgi:uncharacterized protein YbcC (UPF0753/DUF2309 family)
MNNYTIFFEPNTPAHQTVGTTPAISHLLAKFMGLLSNYIREKASLAHFLTTKPSILTPFLAHCLITEPSILIPFFPNRNKKDRAESL